MPLEQDLKDRLVKAMREKDTKTLDVVRMIKTKVMERKTAAGFKGEVDDALYLDVIAAYKKSLAKAKEEFVAVGDRGKDQAEQLDWEMKFCDGFLPQQITGQALRDVVLGVLATSKVTDPKQAGRVVGEVMKTHKGLADAGEVKKIVEEELSKPR
jgi:uncharacterized protein